MDEIYRFYVLGKASIRTIGAGFTCGLPEGTKFDDGEVFLPPKTDFVLASDHDAEIAKRDAEMDRLVSRLSGRLREEIDRCSEKDADIEWLKGEIADLKASRYSAIEVARMKMQKVYEDLLEAQKPKPWDGCTVVGGSAKDIVDEIAKRLRG